MAWCRKCGREIQFVSTQLGVTIPIDPGPLPDGTLMRLPSGFYRVLAEPDRARYPGPLFRSHRVSCPNGVKQA